MKARPLLQKKVCKKGKIVFDKTKPDGTPRKLLDVSTLSHIGVEINKLVWKMELKKPTIGI